MSNRTILVAAREIRAIMRLKSFWFTLISMPLLIALSAAAGALLGDEDADRVMIVDRSGGAVGAALARRIDYDHQRAVMSELARYVARKKLEAQTKGRVWAAQGRWFDDAAVAQFLRDGGVEAAQRELDRIQPDGTSRFEPSDPDYELVPAPPTLSKASDAAVASTAARLTDGGKQPDRVAYVIDIPPGFGASPVARIWSSETPGPAFVGVVEAELTRALRTRLLTGAGVDARLAEAAATIAPAIQVARPRDGEGRDGVLIRSAAPAFFAYLLVLAIFISGAWMLQGTVEERGDKLIESVLACVDPAELLHGKLLGAVAVTATIIVAWLGAGAATVPFLPEDLVDLIHTALAPMASATNIVAILYFFVSGYLLISMLFLAVGSLSNSMQESQAYLTPIMLLVLLPVSLLLQPSVVESGGMLLTVLQWIPLYTPFVMLVRLGQGVALWELLASAALVAGFLALEFVAVGRLFRATLLRTGQPPRLTELVRLIRTG